VAEALSASVAEGFSAGESTAKFAAEVSVAGKVTFGYNMNLGSLSLPQGVERAGWWRISFRLDDSAVLGGATISRNVTLDALATSSTQPTFPPQIDPATNVSWVDIYVTP
jgi:hypothetical protein